jgi:5'-methylthioadenosine phosphorylase
MIKIGIIGGSGLDDSDLISRAGEIETSTPYGAPSSPLFCGSLNGREVVMIARHGRKHQYSPSQVNYRANIHALKDQGVTHILATTACGSLREEIDRGDFVILDQFIDFTRRRHNTFFDSFEDGARHTSMADPFDPGLRDVLTTAATEMDIKVHGRGTVVTIEGPRFSSRAESHMFRSWGADVINMSIAPEVILANEAGIPYAAVAMSTDYDCWKADEAPVTWEEILEVFQKNASNVEKLLVNAVSKITSSQKRDTNE